MGKATKSLGFEGKVVVKVNTFNREDATIDKNGLEPVIVQVLAGKAPNRIVLSGTIAANAGLEPGKTYLAQCREQDFNEEYGRQFIWTGIKELSMYEILDAEKALGKPFVFDSTQDNNDTRAEKTVPRTVRMAGASANNPEV